MSGGWWCHALWLAIVGALLQQRYTLTLLTRTAADWQLLRIEPRTATPPALTPRGFPADKPAICLCVLSCGRLTLVRLAEHSGDSARLSHAQLERTLRAAVAVLDANDEPYEIVWVRALCRSTRSPPPSETNPTLIVIDRPPEPIRL